LRRARCSLALGIDTASAIVYAINEVAMAAGAREIAPATSWIGWTTIGPTATGPRSNVRFLTAPPSPSIRAAMARSTITNAPFCPWPAVCGTTAPATEIPAACALTFHAQARERARCGERRPDSDDDRPVARHEQREQALDLPSERRRLSLTTALLLPPSRHRSAVSATPDIDERGEANVLESAQVRVYAGDA